VQKYRKAEVSKKKFSYAVFLLFCASVLLHFCSVLAYAQPVTHIEVSGLYSISENELLYLINIKKGETLDRAALRSGIKRAFLKGIFEDIVVESIDDDDTKIKVIVEEKKIIDSIRVVGNDYFSSRFIKKHFSINKGERLHTLRIKRAEESLKAELVKRGFINADIMTNIIPKKTNKVDIEVNITEGKPEIIKKIIISGPEDIVISYLRLSEGDIFDRTKMEALKEKVAQYYKKQRHIETSLLYSYDNGVLDISLNAGKKLNISFNGNYSISSKILMKEVPFFDLNAFNYDLVEETTARITALYHQYGYPFAQLAPAISTSEDEIFLEFFIFEGNRHVVQSIILESIDENLAISQEVLKEILALKIGDPYNPDLLESDRETLAEFYHSLGYIYVQIQEPDVKISDNKVEVRFFIKQGAQVKLSGIEIKNNRHITEDEILKVLPLKAGNPYNEVDISNARRKILEIYSNQGFIDVVINIERAISDTSAYIVFDISEGDITLFGKTVLIGNERTKQEVIRREFLHKDNNPLNYSLVLQGRHRLYRLGLFRDVEVKLADKENSKRDVIYKFQEAPAGAVEFGFGYGDYEGLRGFFDISYRNLWGMHRQASIRTDLSALEKRFTVSYYEPWFIEKDLAFKALLLYEDRKEKNIETGEIRYRIKRNTASAGIEKKLSETIKSEFYYDFSVVKTIDVQPDIILSKEDTGTLIISGLRSGLIYDTRDNPFEPKRGVLAGLSFKFASALLFSETDFAKLSIYANKYQSLSKRVVLALSLRGGVAQGFRDTRELPIVERFFLGGRTTVRGYEQDTIGPKGVDGTPTGGNTFAMGNLEFRINVGKGFGVVAFFDAGNVWKKAEDMDITTLKYTTGLGLRYNTPVGPFRVDYGHKLDKERGQHSGEIHFSIGHAF
jgi:outer membrane protein insertion porin family